MTHTGTSHPIHQQTLVPLPLKTIHYPTTSSSPTTTMQDQATIMLHLYFSNSFLSGLPPSSLAPPTKSLLHIEDKAILLKCKSGQATTLFKVLQRHSMSPKMELSFWYGLQDPTWHKFWPPWHFQLLVPVGHRHAPTPRAFVLALRRAKVSPQGFCSWGSFCPMSPHGVPFRALVRSLPWSFHLQNSSPLFS